MSERPDRRAELRDHFVSYAETRDAETRALLVEAHLGLARHLARRFANRGEAYDDLVQVGSMALVKAVDRFDPEQGVAFTTFATRTILGELKRHFRDKGWAVRAPRRIQELYVRLSGSISELSQELGRSPTIAELARDADATEEDVLEALEAGQGYRTTSLEAPLAGGEDESLGDRLGDDDPAFGDAELRAELGPLLSELPARERTILGLRFIEGLTQSEIATRVGISQMQVSRLLARSLGRLREQYTSNEVTGQGHEVEGPRSRPEPGSSRVPAREVS